MHGLDEYDYHARGMYPALMRFSTIDPLAEKYYSFSPYSYCGNNPIIYIDPDGRKRIKVEILNFSMSSGFIGASLNLFGLVGGEITVAPGGGVRNAISGYVLIDTNSKDIGVGGSFEHTDYKYSIEGQAHFINGSSSSEKKATYDANTIDGPTVKKDKSYSNSESAGVVLKKTTINNGTESTQVKASVSADALMVGVQVSAGVTIEEEPKSNTTKQSTQNTNEKNQKKPSKETDPLILF